MSLLSSSRPLSTAYDAALLDLDGVVYIGGAPVVSAPEALEKARAAGMATAFVTNNAARTPAAVAERLRTLGVSAAPDDVVTSAQAGARLLATHLPQGAAVLVVGDMGLRLALREQGLRPVTAVTEQPRAVILGFTPRLGYDALREACVALNQGGSDCLFVATNGDTTVPTAQGPGPGNGAITQVVTAATGRDPLVAGKPERPLHDLGAARTEARHALVVGDRLDTDILGAHRRGSDSLLVLSGVTTPIELVLATPELRPSYIAADLRGLNESHPGPELAPDAAVRCGDWTVRIDGSVPQIQGDGNALDGLRALCGAVWSAGAQPGRGSVATALAQLGWD